MGKQGKREGDEVGKTRTRKKVKKVCSQSRDVLVAVTLSISKSHALVKASSSKKNPQNSNVCIV